MDIKQLKKLLLTTLDSIDQEKEKYVVDPKRDFIRQRKLCFKDTLLHILSMGGGTILSELSQLTGDIPSLTVSAFTQQRYKIRAKAFKNFFHLFSDKLSQSTQNQLRILAIDGSSIHIPTDPTDEGSYFPSPDDRKAYNLLHLNALFDLEKQIYTDVIIQKGRDNERSALNKMIARSKTPKALIIGDRGYESYNTLAHIREKGWFFLIRIRNNNGIISGVELPNERQFDKHFTLKLTRKQTNETKELFKDRNFYRFIPANVNFDFLPQKSKKTDPTEFYSLDFRIVRFPVSEDKEVTVVTDLNKSSYPAWKLKELYHLRWGIETAFRTLKHTLGLLNFHSKKIVGILQEIYAKLIMYNFTQMIINHVSLQERDRSYQYKVNFTVAVRLCRSFIRGKAPPKELESCISQNILPIRNGRHHKRSSSRRKPPGFNYRIT